MRFLSILFLVATCLGCREEQRDGIRKPPAPAEGTGSAKTQDSVDAAQNRLAPPPESLPPTPASGSVASRKNLRMIGGYAYGKDSLTLAFEGKEDYRPGIYKYLALSGHGLSVRLDTVNVEIRNDSVSGFYTGQGIGTVVSMAMAPNQLACFHPSMGLEAGAVKTWYLDKTWGDRPATPPEWVRLTDSTRRKTLDLPGLGKAEFYPSFGPGEDITEYGELNLARPFHWNLRIGTDSAIAFPTVEEPWVDPSYSSADEALLWVGDLDRDGKPDVLLSPVLGPDQEGRLYQIFLSRDLVAGQEWKPAAEFSYYPPGMGD